MAMKQAFLAAGFLAQFDPNCPAVVEADALDCTLGGCLLQLDSKMGILCPVAFYSRKLIRAKEQYKIYDKEMLAIVKCLK